MRIIICGFGSAGYAASMAIRRDAPKTEILVIDPKPMDILHPCGLPYALEGIVDPDNLMQDLNLGRSGITRIQGRAEKIFTGERVVSLLSESGSSREQYDKLIITTGSRPVIPGITGIERFMGKSIFTLAGLTDLLHIKERIKNTDRCVIIGGGAIGIETAFAVKNSVREVTVIEMREQLLPGILDPDISDLIEEYLLSSGISVIKGRSVKETGGGIDSMKIDCGDIAIEAGIAILAAGFTPDISIAELSGLEVLPRGIKTDSYMRTSDENIYAAGDCIAGWSTIDGRPVNSKLATSAYKQGRIAGINAAGGNEEYHGSSCTFVTRIGALEAAGTGLTSAQALACGFEPVSGKITSKIRPEYYPENSDITVKVIFDRNSGIILGAQSAGMEGAASRINLISMAVEFGITIDELCRVELAYCPAVSEVYDPLLRAADFGIRRLKR